MEEQDATEDLDGIDAALAEWKREIPELDVLTEGIVERIQTLAKALDRSLEETLVESGLDVRSYHLLGKLRRYGPPYRRSPGQLATDLHLTSGAMTNRLDRMERAGLIRRLPDPDDRRGILIEPTDLGNAMWDRATGTQAGREAMFASVLDESERAHLHGLLRRLMRAFPGRLKHGHPDHDEAHHEVHAEAAPTGARSSHS